MTAAKTRTKRWRESHDRLLGAAREHMLEVGPDRFSLREVARLAEYSPAALYNHFENKDALIAELAMSSMHLLGDYMQWVPTDAPPADRLTSLGDAYMRFAEDEPALYRLVFDSLESPIEGWSTYTEVGYPFTALVEAVRDGLVSGEFEDVQGVGAGGIAYGLWSTVHGMVMLSVHHLSHIEDDISRMQRAAWRAYVAGITAQPEGKSSKTKRSPGKPSDKER